jgi:hypothetical protein
VQDPDDVVLVPARDGIAAVAVLAADRLDLGERRPDPQRDDLRARHHRVADGRVPEGENGVQEVALLALQAALLAREGDHALDVLLRDVRRLLDAERPEDPAGDGREERRGGGEEALTKVSTGPTKRRESASGRRAASVLGVTSATTRRRRDVRTVATRTPHLSPNAEIARPAPSEPAAAFASVFPTRSVPRVFGRSACRRSRRSAPRRPSVFMRKIAASVTDVIAVSADEKKAEPIAQTT